MKIILTALITLIALSSTVGFADEAAQKKTISDKATPRVTINDEESCKTAGGDWRRVGPVARYYCVLKSKDAGKSCTDGSQCEHNCIAKEGDKPKAGDAATGVCQAENVPPPCMTPIVDGIAQGLMCG